MRINGGAHALFVTGGDVYCARDSLKRGLWGVSRSAYLELLSVSLKHCGTSPLPHPATQRQYVLGGRVGKQAGADSAKLKTTLVGIILGATAFAPGAMAQSRPSIAAGGRQSQPAENRHQSSWRLTSGINFSHGTFGEPIPTDVVSESLSLRYRRGPLYARISLPYLTIDGPASIIDTDTTSGGGTVRTTTQSRSGIGDLGLAAGYSFDLSKTLYLDASVRLKLPTGSTAKRLSTGSTDVTLQGELGKSIGSFDLHASARYKFAGHGTTSPLRDTWGAGAGGSARLNKTITIGSDYDWQQSSFAGAGPSSEVTGWAAFRVTKRLRLSTYVGGGLSRNSADYFAGTALTIRL